MAIRDRFPRVAIVILTDDEESSINYRYNMHKKYFLKNQNIFAKGLNNSKDVVKDFSENRNRIDFDLVQTVL